MNWILWGKAAPVMGILEDFKGRKCSIFLYCFHVNAIRWYFKCHFILWGDNSRNVRKWRLQCSGVSKYFLGRKWMRWSVSSFFFFFLHFLFKWSIWDQYLRILLQQNGYFKPKWAERTEQYVILKLVLEIFCEISAKDRADLQFWKSWNENESNTERNWDLTHFWHQRQYKVENLSLSYWNGSPWSVVAKLLWTTEVSGTKKFYRSCV